MEISLEHERPYCEKGIMTLETHTLLVYESYEL